MNELFLFVRPPRPLWPFNGPSSAFWPPLAFASMAAMLREHIRGLRVEILDAPALEMGWRSLETEIRRRQPAYVGMGEEAVSCVEGLRLARLAKACGARVIAGGCFFGHVAAEALGTGLIDMVVRGEGEATVVELVEALRDGSPDSLAKVDGISFRHGDEVVTTRERELILELDALPFPAYDLLPVDRYGARSRNHPNIASIELGRGCVSACEFCVLWRQMGRFVGGRPVPHLRTKSPERLLEEIRILARTHGRHHLGWVDPCFNADSDVPGRLAELLLKEGIRVGQSAWMRADGIVRDAASGALDACVRAGLNEVYVGVERPDNASLKALHKTTNLEQAREAFRILARDHPQVFTVGTFIYGLPDDTPATIRAMYRLSLELGMDQAFFIPLTPLPGTPFWHSRLWDPTGKRFRQFDFLPSTLKRGARRSLEWTLLASIALDWRPARFRSDRQVFACPDARKRRMTWRLWVRTARFSAANILRGVLNGDGPNGMVFPRWYES